MENDIDEEEPQSFTDKLILNLIEFKYIYLMAIIILTPMIWLVFSTHPHTTGKEELKRKLKKLKGSNFIGSSKYTSPNSQFGGPNWVGAIKSNAIKILRSPDYAKAIRKGEEEIRNYKLEIKKRKHQYLVDLYNNENEDPLTRMMAAARLNPYFEKGREAFQSKDLSNAEYNLMKVLNDSQANPLAKVMACQFLAQIASKRENNAAFIKWIDKMGKELTKIKDLKGFNNLKKFANTYSGLLKVTSAVNTNAEAIKSAFKRSGISQQSANNRIKALKKTSHDMTIIFGIKH